MPNVNEKVSKSATNTSAAYIESLRDTRFKVFYSQLNENNDYAKFWGGGQVRCIMENVEVAFGAYVGANTYPTRLRP